MDMNCYKVRIQYIYINILVTAIRGASKTAATSLMRLFLVIVNELQPLTIVAKSSFSDIAAVLDLSLSITITELLSFSLTSTL